MQLGIDEFDGETIKVCFGAVVKDRPNEFTAKKDRDAVH
jgi:hypothetical protein